MLEDLLDRTPPKADRRIHYGAGELQFGDLWLPSGAGRRPLVVFLHGGWWRAQFDLAYGGHLCSALRAEGLAVWSIEYRRVGDAGGGWPGTFQDVAAGFDFVGKLAETNPIDLTRVVGVGHSAGAQLAFWLAGRHHVPHENILAEPQPRLGIKALIALAGAVDLRLIADLAGHLRFGHDRQEVYALMGGPAAEFGDRYRAGNPGDLLPLSVPQTLIQGTGDGQIPQLLPVRWADMARRQGDAVRVTMISDTGHFDVVDPLSRAWPTVRDALKAAAFG